MKLENIITLKNSIISTPQIAVLNVAKKITPIAIVGEEKLTKLRYIYELSFIIGQLWQGCVYLQNIEDGKINISIVENFEKFWSDVFGSGIEDAMSIGLTYEQFINSMLVWRFIPGACINTPSASISISRMLDCQFNLGASPRSFLLRHLGLSIALKAFAEINSGVSSLFLKKLKELSFFEDWIDMHEINMATKYCDENCLSNHFRFLVIKEVYLMSDLFELVLIKLAEQIKAPK